MTALREDLADGRSSTRGREFYTEALREYLGLYDELTAACFSPGSAKRNGRPDLVERYYAGRPSGGNWPSLNAIKSAFGGSFNTAREAIGLEPNSTGPASGRRKPGEAVPILDVRERLVYVPNERTRQLQARVSRLEERLASALDRARRAETVVAEMRERRGLPTAPAPAPARAPAPRPEVRTKTITKTVKVRDERALERLRGKLANEQTARRAAEAAQRQAERDRATLQTELRDARAQTQDAGASADLLREEALSATRERDRADDRLAAAEALTQRLREELEDARTESLGVQEAAAASDLVRAADRRTDEAEVRAARAERELAEQGAAVTGEPRRLTPAELKDLRARGPAGPVVLGRALQQLGGARRAGSRQRLAEALVEVARAALTWKDRL